MYFDHFVKIQILDNLEVKFSSCVRSILERLISDQPLHRANWQEDQDVMYHNIDLNELHFTNFSQIQPPNHPKKCSKKISKRICQFDWRQLGKSIGYLREEITDAPLALPFVFYTVVLFESSFYSRARIYRVYMVPFCR